MTESNHRRNAALMALYTLLLTVGAAASFTASFRLGSEAEPRTQQVRPGGYRSPIEADRVPVAAEVGEPPPEASSPDRPPADASAPTGPHAACLPRVAHSDVCADPPTAS